MNKLHERFCTLSVTAAWSFSDSKYDNAIRYVQCSFGFVDEVMFSHNLPYGALR